MSWHFDWTPFCCVAHGAILSAALNCILGCNASVAPTQVPARATRQSSAANNAPATVKRDPWRRAIPTPATDSPWSYPAPSVSTLSNGVAVYFLPRKTGPVSLCLLVSHGASDVKPEKSGLASLVAKMMAEATKTKNHLVLSETAESLGSTLTGDANRDYISLNLDTLPEDVAQGIGLLAETVTAPAFEPKDFARLQKQHLDDLIAERQMPPRLASMVGLRAVLGERLGSPVGGRVSTVQRLTIHDVVNWHHAHVNPASTALIVLGPADVNSVHASAEKSLARLRGTQPKPEAPTTDPAPNSPSVLVVDRAASVQSAIFVAQAFPKRGEPGYAARQILDNIIGGQFTSRVNQNLREQHAYTYGARSSTVAARDFGLFTISTSVETKVTGAAIQEIRKELTEIKAPTPAQPILPEEVLRARTGVVQSLGAHLEDGHRLLLDLQQLFVFRLPLTYFNDHLSEVRGLDHAAIVKETQRFTPDRLTIVVVGDLSSLSEQLKSTNLSYAVAPAAWLD